MHLIKKLKYNRVLQISSRLYSEFSNNMQSCLTRYQKQSRSNILPSSYPKKKKKKFSLHEAHFQLRSQFYRTVRWLKDIWGLRKQRQYKKSLWGLKMRRTSPSFSPCVSSAVSVFFFLDGFCVVKEKKNSWGYFSPFISTEESDLSLFTNPVSSSALTSSVGAAASRFLSSSSFTFRFAVTPRGGLTSVVVESGAERSQTVGPSHFGISSPSNSISCFMTSST